MPIASRLLLKGSILRIVLLLTSISIGFFIFPFLIHSLGDEMYGLWIYAGSVVAFYNVLDFGIVSGAPRFSIRAIQGNDQDEINSTLSTTFIANCLISILAIIITIIIVFSTPYFTSNIENISSLNALLLILGMKFAVLTPLYAIHPILAAKFRYDLTSLIQIIFLVTRTVITVIFVNNGYGIITVAIISVTSELASSGIIAFYAKKQLKDLHISFSLFSFAQLKEYFHFGKFVYFINLSNKIRLSSGELVIGGFIGAVAVTHYTIAATLITYFSQAIVSLVGVTNPLFIKYHKLNQWDNLKEIFLVSTEITILLATLIGSILMVLGDSLISVWIGDSYNDVYFPLLTLTLATIMKQAQYPCTLALYALAKHKYLAKILILEAIANLTLSIIFIQYFGILGVALGMAISMLLSSLYLIPIYTCRQLHINPITYYKILGKYSLLGILIFIPVLLMVKNYHIDSYLKIIFFAILATLIFLLCAAKIVLSKKSTKYIIDASPNKITPYLRIVTRKY